MRRIIQLDKAYRVLSMILAIVMLVSVFPLSVFAINKSELTTDITEKTFVVGEPTEFTFTTIANDDLGTYVLGSFEFDSKDSIASLQYLDSSTGEWREFYGDFGPATGFPMTNATSHFRVTFKSAGTFTLRAFMKTVPSESGEFETLCEKTVEITVEGKSSVSTDIGSESFVVNQSKGFTVSTVANADDANTAVNVGFSVSGASEDDYLIEHCNSENVWREVEETYGGAEGFLMTETPLNFRITFTKAGKYKLTVKINKADGSTTLCFTTVDVTVKSRPEIKFAQNGIKMKFTDKSAINAIVDANGTYTYKSDNESVVTVNENGVLEPKGTGTTTITVTRAEDDNYVEGSASYTVTVDPGDQNALKWENSTLDPIAWNVGSFTNKASGGTGEGAITYSVDNTELATVNSEGVLTLYKPGTVTVTATKSGGDLYEDQTSSYTLVIIKAKQEPLKFTNNEQEISISAIEEFSNVATGGSSSEDIVYKSDDEKIAVVDTAGSVKINRIGSVVITAYRPADDYYEESEHISYTLNISIGLQASFRFENGTDDKTIKVGDKYNNQATGNIGSVSYSSSNDTIATVGGDGTVTALKAGEVTITASVSGNSFVESKEISYKLVIERADQVVEFNDTVIPLLVYGDEYQNKASAKTDITYTSSDDEIAEVNLDGKLIIHKAGIVTITATAMKNDEYNEATAQYSIQIDKADQIISFEKKNEITVTFDEENNKFSNSASSNAFNDKINDNRDIIVEYSIREGNTASCDPKTGDIEILGAGTIIVNVSFGGNDRYNSKTAEYILIVNKAAQTIEFPKNSYSMISGTKFEKPELIDNSRGSGAITYRVEDPHGIVDNIDNEGNLTFTTNVGTVTVIATKEEDANYLSATARYSLDVSYADSDSSRYSIEGSKVDGSDWYNGDVSIVAADGYKLCKIEAGESDNTPKEWTKELKNVVTEDGTHTIEFLVMPEVAESGTSYENIEIKKDSVCPQAKIENKDLGAWEKILTIITLGMWEPDHVKFSVTADDGNEKLPSVSGLTSESVKYYVDYGTTELRDEAFLNALTDDDWQAYNANTMISVEKDQIFVVYAKVVDNAGNYVYASTNGIVFDRTAVPVENIVFDIQTESVQEYYNSNVEIKLSVEDAAPSSGIKSISYRVLNNNKQTQSGDLFKFEVENQKYEELVSSWNSDDYQQNIIVDAELNNSDNVKVEVTVVDNADNTSTKSISLKICTTKFQLDVSYVDDPDPVDTYDGVTYYAKKRTAKITITGRKTVFDLAIPEVVITEAGGDSTIAKTYTVDGWNTVGSADGPDKATHTYYINFNGDANYKFSVKYVDIFGNELTYSSDSFTVDLNAPTASLTINNTDTWTKLLETLTFGLWSKNAVSVELNYNDTTSPLKSVEYFKTKSTEIYTSTQLENAEWETYNSFDVTSDETFVVYARVIDYAGHIKYVCTDGYVVDMTNSTVAITPLVENESELFAGDFDVRIDVEDKFNESYSGIKSVEYWIECNGRETIRQTLFSYEYTRENADHDSNGGRLVVRELNEKGELAIVKNRYDHTPVYKDELYHTFTKTITVDSKANNGSKVAIYVKVVDNAGNEQTYSRENLSVDVVAPKIEVSFDVNGGKIVGDRGYFMTERIATIVYTERTENFDREKAAEGIVFSGVDANGESVTFDRSSMIVWGKTVEDENNPDATTHTAYVYFDVDANYDFTISYTDNAGNACNYEDVKFADRTKTPRYFTVDTEKPTATVTVAGQTWDKLAEVLTFGIFRKSSIVVKATAEDKISPVTIKYYKTSDTEILDKNALDVMADSDWTAFSDLKISKDERFFVYLKVMDSAGNYIYVNSDGHIIDMAKPVITLTPDETDFAHGDIPLYNNDVDVLIDIAEKKDDTYSGINKVEYWVVCDGKETQREVLYSFENPSPAYEELLSSYSRTVTILSEKNNSCDVTLYVSVTDNSGNYAESSVAVDIDVTAPTIKVTYDNNSEYKVVDGKGYFPVGRTATVVITERSEHFDAAKATENIKITAVDANGNAVFEDCAALISAWKTEGTGNSATHTATIDFSADANYTFDISYTDLANNSNDGVDVGNSVTPYMFAVDTTAPVGTVTAGELGTWDKLVEVLTFGLWSKETVDVNGTFDDATTNIESISYYKTADTKAKTAEDLKEVTEWADFDGISVPADEKFAVYVRVIDDAGNVTYISTNGIITDNTAPSIESVKPEITITPEPALGIYSSDVTIGVSVFDPISEATNAYVGLKEIRYEVYNLGAKTQDGVLYSFDVADPSFEDLTQSWSKADAIVVNKDLNNSNDVRIVVYAVDNIGNESQAECNIKIDITAPVIDVRYDNNDGDVSFNDSVYFKANRTATIVVTERNFDPSMVTLAITNTENYIPEITGWTTVQGGGNGDGTTHTAYVVFNRDGDYTFDISCTDTANNASTAVDYANSLAPQEFTVDKTLPVINISYNNNESLNGNYYKAERTATITITEHNFETGRITVKLEASDDDIDSALPVMSAWSSRGNVHTATIVYSADSYYTFDIEYTDKAGNEASDVAEHTFYVDKTTPSLVIEKIVDESANNDEGDIGFVMTATDTNFDVFTPVLNAVINTDGKFETKQIELGVMSDIDNGKKYTVTNLDADGIYRITCTLVDKAGNAYTEVMLENADGTQYTEQRSGDDNLVTFSVNRFGSTFEIDDNTMNVVKEYYVKNLEEDIVVVEINADPLKEYGVALNGKTLTEDTDYTVSEEGGDGSWMKYTYKVNKDLFNGEGEYKLVVSSKDKADNDAFSDVKDATVEFVVDRTAPVVTVSGLTENGRYQTDKHIVTLIPTDDGGSLNSIIVNMVDENGNVIKEVLNLSGEAFATELENNEGKINFEITEGLYQNVQIICTDNAADGSEGANTYNTTIKNVSVSSSVFMIFWANKPLRWGTIGGVTAAVIALILIILKKKKRKEDK